MTKPTVYVLVEGGIALDAFSDDADVSVIVVDLDIDASEPYPLQPLGMAPVAALPDEALRRILKEADSERLAAEPRS